MRYIIFGRLYGVRCCTARGIAALGGGARVRINGWRRCRVCRCDAQELSFEVGGFRGSSAFSWSRYGESLRCYACGTAYFDGFWHHIVATINYTSGDAAFYVNGTALWLSPGASGPTGSSMFKTPPRAGGEVMVGAGLDVMDGRRGTAQVNQLASAAIDDLRIHNRPLTPAEISAGAWRLPDDMGPDYARSLVLHWAFDDPHGAVEEDLSGSGNHGLRGGLDGHLGARITYGQSNQPVPVVGPGFVNGVTSPRSRRLDSTESGGQGASISRTTTMFASRAVPTQIVMLADIDRRPEEPLLLVVTAVPEAGTLRFSADPASRIVTAGEELGGTPVLYFHPPEAWGKGSYNIDDSVTLLYRVAQSGMYAIDILAAPQCFAPDRTFEVVQGRWHALELGTLCEDGHVVQTEITSLPQRGRLHRFKAGMQLWPLYYELQVQDVRCITTPIHVWPNVLERAAVYPP